MGRYGDLKAGPNNRCTANDMECWRDLVAAARAVGGCASGVAIQELRRVVKAAKDACAPGVVTRANPCVVLVRLARRWLDETASGRLALTPDLVAAVDGAAEALDAAGGRKRKDIDE